MGELIRDDLAKPRIAHCDQLVGVRVRARRQELEFSQRELAFPGCSYAYLSRIEAGTRTPSLQTIRQLAIRLETTESWLAWGEDDPLEYWKERALKAEQRLKETRRALQQLRDGGHLDVAVAA